jgi:hypothetical protein
MKTPALVGKTAHCFVIVVAAALSCFAQPHVPLVDPIPAPIPLSPVKINLQTITSGLVSPVAGAVAPGDRHHLYVADQIGQVWRLEISKGGKQRTLFLDVSSRLVPLGLGPRKFDERGLLGIAFHPNFRENGLFYTFTSEPVKGRADFSTIPAGVDPNCQSVLLEWRVRRADNHDQEIEDGDDDDDDDSDKATTQTMS